MAAVLVLLACVVAAARAAPDRVVAAGRPVHAAVLGDWGINPEIQKAVADKMALVAAATQAYDFVVSTGDNFYVHGVANVADPLFRTTFEDMYTQDALQVPWYPIVGNHDCRGNVTAQVAYSARSPNGRWTMPGRYYRVTYSLDGNAQLQMFFLDACTLVCNTPRTGKADFETADCRDAGSATDRLNQLQWLEDALDAADAAAAVPGAGPIWRVVVAHWPVLSAGNHGDSPSMQASLLPLFARHRVHAVLAGHDHGLQHLVLRTETSGLPHTHTGLGDDSDDDLTTQVFVSAGGGYKLDPVLHQHENLVAGYLTHGFVALSVAAAQLHVRFYNADAANVAAFYETTIAP